MLVSTHSLILSFAGMLVSTHSWYLPIRMNACLYTFTDTLFRRNDCLYTFADIFPFAWMLVSTHSLILPFAAMLVSTHSLTSSHSHECLSLHIHWPSLSQECLSLHIHWHLPIRMNACLYTFTDPFFRRNSCNSQLCESVNCGLCSSYISHRLIMTDSFHWHRNEMNFRAMKDILVFAIQTLMFSVCHI
jgi:hypothetical protein